ncbi:two-partner secretion domain-containing protein [Gloeomargarita lithophora]|uniref:two-partner secretion domain-containing protein n=1 Tax=Gloeomargarita lithophora TaxID=1188228 RepID=UPI0012FE3F2C
MIQQESATKLNINQSTDRAVINWNSFSIGAPEWVNFQQPSSTSATLNRVTGNTPSSIAGKLTANGQIFLINPNGIMFLPTARVDVAGLVASTLNIKDSDFMRGVLRFEQMSGKAPASVVNQGLITVKEAGFAALVAPAVQNSGVISARLGKVVLASGTTVSLDFYGDGLLSVTVDPKLAGQITDIYGNKLNSLIDNQGNITAPGGIVTLTAQAAGQIVDSVINTSGIIEAKYAENRNGVIVLSGGSQGIVAVNGELNVSGERGGKVEITGENVGLFGAAKIDASGDKAGGLILIGGDYLGGRADKQRIDPSLNAQNTFVSSQSILTADARIAGNGGEVIIWADNFTRFDGTITATGDNGGFVETSGKNILEIGDSAKVDTTGKIGSTGTWLLDPLNLSISGSGTNANVTGASPFTPTGTGSILRDTTINNALLTNNVVVKTVGTSGADRGDIIFNNNANVNWSTNKTFTVQAAGQIFMNDGTKVQSTNTGSFNAITFKANTADAVTGDMTGIDLQQGSELSTQGGKISLTGIGGQTGNSNFGILHKAVVQSTTGSITYKGTGGKGVNSNYGVYLLNPIATTGAKIASTTGVISITGTGRGTGQENIGIVQELGAQVSSTSGAITYIGKGATTGTDFNRGIILTNENTTISTTTGAITLTGTGGGTGQQNQGIFQTAQAQVSTQGGNITYTGTGSNGSGTSNTGIVLADDGTKISTINAGKITLTGTGGTNATASKNRGIFQVAGAQVSTVNGAISYTGTGGNATNNNYGIHLEGVDSSITTTGTGTITLTGKGQGTGTENYGILQRSDAKVTTANSIITYKGTGAVTADGIRTESGTNIIGNNTTKSIVLTSLKNGITLNDVTIQTKENIIITSPGDVTQNNNGGLLAITANKGLQLNGAGNYTLTNVNNDIATLAAKNTGNISFQDTNGFVVGTVGTITGITTATTKNITLTSGGEVTQTQKIVTGGLELTGTGGTYTLTNTGNNIVTLAADTQNNLSFTDRNGLIIGTVGTTNGITATNKNVTLTVNAGTLTQTKAITASGLELKGNGTFTLTNANNDVTTLAANVGNPLSFTDQNTLTIGTVNTTNGITTSNDAVTLKTGDLLTINKAIAVGNQKVSIESAGVTQGTDGKITGSGLRLLGTGTFNLNNTANNIALLAANVTGSLTYVDANVMAIDTVLGTTGVKTNNNSINISTVNGNLTLSNLTGNKVDAGTGTVNLTAGGNSIFTNNAKASVIGSGGVTITANRMTLNTGSTINSGINITTLQPNTAGRLINLGGADVAATTLGLTSAELNTVTAGTLRVGKNDAGNITVSAAIAPAGTNTLTLITNGTVTQNAGATITETNLAIKAGGNITLNQNNQITNFAASTTGNVTLNDLGGLNVDTIDGVNGLVTTPVNVDLKTTGNITQSAGADIITSGLTTLDAGTGNITLNNTSNNFTNLKIANSNNAVFTNLIGLNIQGINTTGDVTINPGGAVTQTGAIIANTLNLQSPGFGYTLDNASNNIVTLNSNNTGTITYTDVNDFSVGNLTTNNANVTLNAPNVNAITFTGNVNVSTGNLAVTSGTINQTGGSIIVNGTANFTSTKANTGNVIAKNTTATQLGNSVIGGDFTLTSTGNVTQSGSLKVAGITTITAPNGLSDLTDPGNLLPSVFSPATGDLTVTGIGTVDLPTKSITGDLTVTSNATGSGFASIFSDSAIQLNQNNNFTGTVSFNTQTAAIGSLSGTPAITQSGVQTVGGTSTFNAVNGTIDLNLNNQLTGAVTLNTGVGGGNITFKNDQAIVITGATTAANLNIVTNGNLTQIGTITAGGISTFNAGTNDITLNLGNDFNTLELIGNNAKITDTNGFVITGANITNILSLTAGDTVTQSGAINANGLALLGSGKFTLNNPGNTITTIAADTKNDISFVNSKTLTVGTVNPTGITTTGTVLLQALQGDIILDNSVTSTATKNAITLVADDDFINNAGKAALSAVNGRWLVYATSPQDNKNGGLTGAEQFNTPFPQPALFIGNGFLYRDKAPFVPGLPNELNEPITFTLNFNDREWRDLTEFSEQSALVESLVCTSDTALANASDATLIILDRSINPLAFTQRVFFANDGLPSCDAGNQASN